MKIIDKYKYFKEQINFDINLESYISKLKQIIDETEINLFQNIYSPRLFLNDEDVIIINSREIDEEIFLDSISYDLSIISDKEFIEFNDCINIEVIENKEVIYNYKSENYTE